jgi:hypothetical protein
MSVSRMAKKAPTLNDRVLQETEEAVNSTFSFLVDEEDDENLRLVNICADAQGSTYSFVNRQTLGH